MSLDLFISISSGLHKIFKNTHLIHESIISYSYMVTRSLGSIHLSGHKSAERPESSLYTGLLGGIVGSTI